MNRHIVRVVVALASVTLCAANVQDAFGDRQKVAECTQLLRLLDEQVEMKDFQAPMSLKEAFWLLMEKFASKGKELPIIVEAAEFRKEHPDLEIYDQQVSFQPFPKRLALGKVLKMMLSKVTQADATFLIRDGAVVVTTEKETRLERLLQRKVIAEFINTPFADALEELSAGTGASIVMDVRVADKLKSPVTATLKNDVSLESALRMLADMVDLKVVVLPAGIYVTHPFHADNLEKELADRKKRAETRRPARSVVR